MRVVGLALEDQNTWRTRSDACERRSFLGFVFFYLDAAAVKKGMKANDFVQVDEVVFCFVHDTSFFPSVLLSP